MSHLLDIGFEAKDRGREAYRLRHLIKKITGLYADTVTLPPGESRLVKLHDSALDNSFESAALCLRSDVEGVVYWPIDHASPAVSPTTSGFGWQVDPSAPVYEHDHGAFSYLSIDHSLSGEDKFYETLPTWQSYKKDFAEYATAPFDLSYVEAVDITASGEPAVGYRGKAAKMDMVGISPDHALNTVAYMWGLSGRRDFGTPGDGLGFTLVYYVDDAAKMKNDPILTFHCWPFTDRYQEVADLPALSPQGREFWAQNDRMLCRTAKSNVSAATIGWHSSHLTDGASFVIANATPSVNGWQARRYEKDANLLTRSAVEPNALPGAPIWRRMTMVTFRVDGVLEDDDFVVYIANLYFGPLPGLTSVLRPDAIDTSHYWGTSNKPHIGLMNPTQRTAHVEVLWGREAA